MNANGTFPLQSPPPPIRPASSFTPSMSMTEALQHPHHDSSVFYGRIQLPSISMAIVDSVKVRSLDFVSHFSLTHHNY